MASSLPSPMFGPGMLKGGEKGLILAAAALPLASVHSAHVPHAQTVHDPQSDEIMNKSNLILSLSGQSSKHISNELMRPTTKW